MAVLSFLGNFYFLSAVLVLLLVALALAIVVLIRVWRSDTHPISTSDYYVTLRPARTEVVLRPAEHTDILTAPLTIENKTRGRVAFVFKVPAEVIDAYGVRPLSGTLEQGTLVHLRTTIINIELVHSHPPPPLATTGTLSHAMQAPPST